MGDGPCREDHGPCRFASHRPGWAHRPAGIPQMPDVVVVGGGLGSAGRRHCGAVARGAAGRASTERSRL